MPTYCYECGNCGALEVEQKITEGPLNACPECNAIAGFRKLIAPVAVLFKGAGFHINDYAAQPAPAEGESCSGEPKSCGACTPPPAEP